MRVGSSGWIHLVVCTVAGPVVAQAPDTTKAVDSAAVVLRPVEVIATILPVASPIIASGIPARIATIGGGSIDAWEPRTLADALPALTGVSLYDDLGSPYKLNLSTRGFNVGPVVGLPPGVSVFLDGVRQNEPDAAQVNFDLLPLEHVKRIELLSGSASLLGANSLGGAINLITRRGTGPPEGEIEVSAGSFDTYSAEGSIAGLSGGWDYYVGGGYESSGGWRAATGARNYNGFLNLGRLGSQHGVSFQAFGAKSRAETAGSLPESIFDAAPKNNFTAGDFENLDLLQLRVSAYAPVGVGRGAVTVFYRRHNAERFNVNQAPDPDVRGLGRNRTLGGTVDWRWTTVIPPGLFSLRFGIDGAANEVNVRLFEEDGNANTLTTDVDSPSWDLAGFALTDLQVGRVTVSGGFRYDVVRVPFADKLDPSADTSNTFRRFSPRGGVSVDIGSGAAVYTSVGRSFRAPAVLELACADETAPCPLPFALGDDPPLDPVVATTYEVGARWRVGSASFDMTFYRTDVQDDISFIASETAVFEGFFANKGKTRREGVEFGTQWSVSDHMVYGNYAYTRATYRTAAEIFSLRSEPVFVLNPLFGENRVEAGNRLPLVPEHTARFGGSLRLPVGLEAGLDARYTGEQWLRGDEANETAPLDSYLTADVRLGWHSGGWEITGVASNVFDSGKATFGTFNVNRQTGELERFLTPVQNVAFRLVVRRSFGVE